MNCSSEVIYKIFSEVESVSMFTISGGEPSLVPEVIENIYNEIMYHKVEIGYVYCVSNGHIHNKYKDFLEAYNNIVNLTNDKECCVLDISRDQFHSSFWNQKYLYKLNEYQEEFPFINLDNRNRYIYDVVSEGRGAKIAGSFDKVFRGVEFDEDENMISGELYISSNGNVTLDCDMSYINIDKKCIGNILNNSLSDILAPYMDNDRFKEEAA
jgi:hypothetical protein